MSSKQLKDLTADDVRSTCESLEARVKLSKEDACEYLGLIASPALGKPCATLKDECISEADESTQGQAFDKDCMPPTDQRAGCTATVAEFEVCLVAQTQLIRQLTCDSVLNTLEATPPDCDAVARKCPQILATEGEGQGAADP